MNISSSGNSFNVVIFSVKGGLDEEESSCDGYSIPLKWSRDPCSNKH
jgi:hypothetical protein